MRDAGRNMRVPFFTLDAQFHANCLDCGGAGPARGRGRNGEGQGGKGREGPERGRPVCARSRAHRANVSAARTNPPRPKPGGARGFRPQRRLAARRVSGGPPSHRSRRTRSGPRRSRAVTRAALSVNWPPARVTHAARTCPRSSSATRLPLFAVTASRLRIGRGQIITALRGRSHSDEASAAPLARIIDTKSAVHAAECTRCKGRVQHTVSPSRVTLTFAFNSIIYEKCPVTGTLAAANTRSPTKRTVRRPLPPRSCRSQGRRPADCPFHLFIFCVPPPPYVKIVITIGWRGGVEKLQPNLNSRGATNGAASPPRSSARPASRWSTKTPSPTRKKRKKKKKYLRIHSGCIRRNARILEYLNFYRSRLKATPSTTIDTAEAPQIKHLL